MRQMAGSLRIHGNGAISVWSNGAMSLPAASTGGAGKAGIAPHVDDDRHRFGAAPGIKGIWGIECLPSSMRKPPRHVECCAVLGPRSQGETALPLRVLLVSPHRKRNRNRYRACEAVFPRTPAALFATNSLPSNRRSIYASQIRADRTRAFPRRRQLMVVVSK